MAPNSNNNNNRWFELKICPFSILVFVSTMMYVTRQKQIENNNHNTTKEREVRNNIKEADKDSTAFHVVFVLGAPGVGKGTQCQLVSERITKITNNKQWIHLSAGDLLRTERKKIISLLATEINRYIDLGQLVPSHITCQLLINAMMEEYNNNNCITHFLIDGFPRSKDNLDAWNTMTTTAAQSQATVAADSSDRKLQIDYQIEFVLNFVCPEEVLIGRLLERGKKTQRSDDTIDTIRTRFRTFMTETKPIIEYYESMYQKSNTTTTTAIIDTDPKRIPIYTIPTDQSIEAVYQQTIKYFI